jgi:hypothetical protein
MGVMNGGPTRGLSADRRIRGNVFRCVGTALAQGVSGAGTVDPANTSQAEIPPTHHIRFSAIGLDHAHIYGMTRAIQRGGGELVSFYAQDPAQIAQYRKEFGEVKLAHSEDEILGDPSVQLILGAPIPDLRAPLGIRAMKAGKDFLGDKPAITSLEQLGEVRKAIRETKRKFAIMYSERLEVRAAVHAGELVQQGAIGKVIQTVNLAPHRMNIRAAHRGSSTSHATAAFSPTSARTRPSSSSTTPTAPRHTWSPRRPATSPFRSTRNSRISATC